MIDPDIRYPHHVRNVQKLVRKLAPILAGNPAEVQSAALADLMATWLAGHQDLNNPDSSEIQELRKELFEQWCATTLDLVPINSRAIRERMK